MHDMLGRSLFPKGEIDRAAFLFLTVQLTSGFEKLVDISAGELAIMEFGVVFLDVEIYGAFADIGVTCVQYFFDKFYLLDDMA